MRKGLVITLGVVALVLVVSPGFATAPIISCVPDIVVSDFEDFQTIDANLFIFADAIDLDAHVNDSDTTNMALLRWSFVQTTGPTIEINDIGSNSSGNVVAPGAFDIRAISNLIDVRNVDWSPTTGTAPFVGPPVGTTQADSLIELFVSDGSNTGSQMVTITSIDENGAGPGDRLVPTPDKSYPFTSNAESWTQFTATNPGVVADAILAFNAAAGGSLDMTENVMPAPGNVEVVFGAWESPKDPAVASSPRFGCIQRTRFQVRSSVDGATCPGFRTRAVTSHVVDSGVPAVGWIPDFVNRDTNSDLTVNYFTPDFGYVAGREPGTAGKTYDMLAWPQQTDSLMTTSLITYVAADLLDLDRSFSDDSGTISVDQVDIDGVSRPVDGTGRAEPGLSFNGNFDTWPALPGTDPGIGVIGGGVHVPPVFTITAAEVALNVQAGAAWFDAAALSSPVALDVGRYYRVTFTVSSSAIPSATEFGPTFRLGLVSSRFAYSVDKNLAGGGLLSIIGATQEPFEVWLQAPPAAGTQTEAMSVRFQSWLLTQNTGFPHNANVSGEIRCHAVVTESFDPPAAP
jgi:hypothetical protein